MSTTTERAPETATARAVRLERRPDGVGVVWIDIPGEPVNVLRPELGGEMRAALEEAQRQGDVKALVIASAKPDGFIAGADIKVLQAVKSAEEAAQLSRDGQQMMEELARSPLPVVAAIHGPCLGGGLELALACRERVASDDRKTKLGLPEVQLGLLPGAGGTQRLPALVGAQIALDLMLTGKELDAKRAHKLGLVDEVVAPGILVDVAAARALRLVGTQPEGVVGRLRETFTPAGLSELGLTGNPLGRRVLFGKAREGVIDQTHGNYPAPLAILEVVKAGLSGGHEAGLAAESEAFGRLAMTPESKALIGLYFAITALKKDKGTDAAVEPARVERVGILGAGLMGSGIAYVTALEARCWARLKDRDPEAVQKGLVAVRKGLDERVERRRLDPRGRDLAMARVSGAADYSGFAGVDIVIEAVFEDLALKHRVLKEVEAVTRPGTVFASNTSSIPIAKIAEASSRPEDVVGMHYFSPVPKMPLLEVIAAAQSAPRAIATAVALGKRQKKTVIVVKDGAGFYTTRILAPYMNEAAHVLAEGVAIEAIDAALVQFGFPVGPILLMDEVGIDVGHKVGPVLVAAYGQRFEPPPGTQRLIDDQRHGRKNGRGFYRWDAQGKKDGQKQVDPTVYQVLGVEPTKKVEPDELAWRCALRLVNEALLCFGEGVLRSARDGDVGAIMGLGFPPFRGGPFRLVDQTGPAEVLRRLEQLEQAHGARFAPAPVLREMVAGGLTFHGEKRVEPGRHPG